MSGNWLAQKRSRSSGVVVRSGCQSGSSTSVLSAHERSLIITWVNRGTLHLIAVEDEPLPHALTTPQLRSASDRRLTQEGASVAAAERGIAAIVKTPGDAGAMTRAEDRP